MSGADTTTLATTLAGALTLRPGGSLPTIRSTRREWAPTLARGRPADRLPDLLAAVLTLCGGAHRVAARHAVAAARGAAADLDAQRRTLQADTLREHLRRLWLDLPRLAPSLPAPDPTELAGCPGLRGPWHADSAAATRTWVETRVLGQPVADWLAAWAADPRPFIERWAAAGSTWPARWMRAVAQIGFGLQQRPVPLQAHAAPRELQRLAGQLRHEADFALAPTWRGHTAETGTWTRLADPFARGADTPYAELTLRLASRIADLAHLLAPGGEAWLAQGGLPLGDTEGPGEGLGWCEMARGLLIHWVRLDAQGAVADCRLIAPTEWNFHPFGSAARALALLPLRAAEPRVRLLAAAYDPCVAVTVDRSGHEQERAHA